MTCNDWRHEFALKLAPENILLQEQNVSILTIQADAWQSASKTAITFNCRFAAIWAKEVNQNFQLNIPLELNGKYLLLRTEIPIAKPEIASWANIYPAANRPERHTHDMFGVIFLDHPDCKRWTRHQAWSETEYPLRKNFSPNNPAIEKETPPDVDYPFFKLDGSGVCEVPVGPVHAGIIEPGHFRFQIAGEDVLNLEERFGYVHKGIEKLSENMEIKSLIRLAGRVSGDSTVAYAWATCQACENAINIEPPKRALFIRAIMSERERVANHLGDIGAICNDVGFAFAYYQFSRLKELWLRLNAEIFQHRFMMDCITFGGVKQDLTTNDIGKMHQEIADFKQELIELFAIIENSESLQDRLKTTGILTQEIAEKIGAVGYVGRASNCDYDLRRDAPYLPYDELSIKVPIFQEGDVAARLKVRAKEIMVSLELINELLNTLPATELQFNYTGSFKNCEGIGLIEAWRGELLVYVSFDENGKIDRYYPRDPSWLNWPALEQLIHGNIVPDFPVCNKSINCSYSGHDL
ncbi:MAG: NADH-quinone oxidoreductase subunit C [Gammaproteobacteria bacterium]|nr:NADH-quinone oxidoreductase subunit C [Gammaproteobacteria bacterium]